MIVWSIVYGLLVAQVILVSFMCIPIGFIQRLVAKLLHGAWRNYWVRLLVIVLALFVSVLLADSVREMMKYGDQKAHGIPGRANTPHDMMDLNQRLFRAQRNVYLTSFNLLMILVEYGFISLLRKIEEQKNFIKTLQAQKKAQ
eukprot:TRINITY_DN35980_c0_g1_i1.p1 TRINITY_DN35980_c0_g1~~TRINITY_DN35980_c0_g1_i1.p1  ORF type:complete len:143 (-),score=20.52 TRINITY_DN35980_c0_g1_i1:75-503(-)